MSAGSPTAGRGRAASPARRATVIGAGSFGTALSVLLARSGLRTTLQARTEQQSERLRNDRENLVYLPGVELPAGLRIEPVTAGVARADHVFLAVPSRNMEETISALAAGATEAQGLNAAGAAAGHIFAEVWRYAGGLGARPHPPR